MYSARAPAGGAYRFGTSGLLYRSNKLMYDRQTYTLWSNLTGEPVVGRLAASPLRLEMRPVALTTWEEWRRRHPGTTVLKLEDDYGARWSYQYRPGAADRARAGVEFPVWLTSRSLARNEEVYALRVAGGAKAYPLSVVLREGVVNDAVRGEGVVLVGDSSGAVRAYRRDGRRFKAGGRPRELLDESGRAWLVEEEALAPAADPSSTSGALPRLAGHVVFWFAWFAFYPDTEIYGGPASPKPSDRP